MTSVARLAVDDCRLGGADADADDAFRLFATLLLALSAGAFALSASSPSTSAPSSPAARRFACAISFISFYPSDVGRTAPGSAGHRRIKGTLWFENGAT